MNDRGFSIHSPQALTDYGRQRIADADAVDGVRRALETMRIPRWALGELDPQSLRLAEQLDVFWDNRDRELHQLRQVLAWQGHGLVRAVRTFDEQDALNAAAFLRTGLDGQASPSRPEIPVSGPVDRPPAAVGPKSSLVERRIDLPGWREPTLPYTDPDGESFDLPAPGLPPVQIGVSTVATFHDYSVTTESNDDLERVLAAYGRQLEEAELVGRAMGSDVGVLGPRVLPLWLSSPDAVEGVAEALTPTVTGFDRRLTDGYGRAVTGIADAWSGRAQRAWWANAVLTVDYAEILRGRLLALVGHTCVVAAQLRSARDACAAIVEEHQAEILAAKDHMLRELAGDTGDPLAALLDLNPSAALLTVYESAVERMNLAIDRSAIAEVHVEPDPVAIRFHLHRLGLAGDAVMQDPAGLAMPADMPWPVEDADRGDHIDDDR